MSLIAPLQFVDRENAVASTAYVELAHACQSRSFGAHSEFGNAKSRTSIREVDTDLSVIAMRRQRRDNRNGRFDMEKI
jgi:hypothetical protein